MTTPQPLSSLVGQGGLELEVAYCVGGVITPPCGVPVSPCRSDPASITPTRSMPRTRPRMARSHTRSSIACINPACGIASNEAATHYPPRRLPGDGHDHPQPPPVGGSGATGVGLEAAAGSPGADAGAARRHQVADPRLVD